MEMNQIVQGDALEVLQTVEDNTFDICITSPPYNIGVHTTHGFKHNPYSDDLPEEEYQSMQVKVLNELFRVIKPNGSLFYNHKNRIVNELSLSPYEWIFKTKWLRKEELVWINGSPNMAKVRFYPFTERVYWLVKSNNTKLTNVLSHPDYWTSKEWPAVGSGNHELAKLRDAQGKEREVEHTRQFPLQMPIDILKCFPEAQTVIDPYSGNATVALAALQLGKLYFGIERNPDYIELGNKRLVNYLENKDRTLFGGVEVAKPNIVLGTKYKKKDKTTTASLETWSGKV
jgi:site-specific DNA-methyltransferase (adenine-specific)